jgi:plasmid stabilization system protein ParE
MKYAVEFRKEALQDILEAIAWYENHREGLGDEFFISLENSKHLIEQNPLQFAQKYKGIRKAIITRFPYIIYFKVENPGKVIVFAVLHMKRSEKQIRQRSK